MSSSRGIARALVAALTLLATLLPAGRADAARARIALVVDNSGSMYGHCDPAPSCRPAIVGNVREALQTVLEIMHAYNARRPEAEQVALVLTLFGGRDSGGAPEFREVVLGADLASNRATIETELADSRSGEQRYFQATDFGVGFSQSIALLTGREEKADITVFLTDALPGQGGLDVDETLEFERLGTTYLFSLGREVQALHGWADAIRKKGMHATVDQFESGWEITSTFATIFQKLLVPERPDRYLVAAEETPDPKAPVLSIAKISAAEATWHVIVHGRTMPRVERVERDGAVLAEDAFVLTAGERVLTLELPQGSAAGAYTLVFQPTRRQQRYTVIGLEAVRLVLVDRLHPQGQAETLHKRNEEVRFHFDFATADAPDLPVLNDEQMRDFCRLLHFRAEVREVSDGNAAATDSWAPDSARCELEHSHRFLPSGAEDARYTIHTGWSYVAPEPPLDSAVGGFVLSKDEAIVLALDISSDRDELWHGRPVTITGRLSWRHELPDELRLRPKVVLRDTAPGAGTLELLRVPGAAPVFRTSLPDGLAPGKHTFVMVEPDPSIAPGIVVHGTEVRVRPRAVTLHVKHRYRQQAEPEAGFFAKLWRGLRYLFGGSDDTEATREDDVARFPYEKPIQVQYYDEDRHALEFTAAVEPLFDDEAGSVVVAFDGSESYAAEDAYEPWFFGLFQGDPHRIEDALRVTTEPAAGALPLADSFAVALEKAECDWLISEPLTPRPRLGFTVVVERGEQKVALPEASVQLLVTTRPSDREIITALRWSAFIALLALLGVLLLSIILLLVTWRAHNVRRDVAWKDLLGRCPEDFCRSGDFPEKPLALIEQEARVRREHPSRTFREAIRRPDDNATFLRRVFKALKLSELRALVDRCKQKNLDSAWEFSADGGAVTVFGSEMNDSERAVRLRDIEELPPVVGHLRLQRNGDQHALVFQPGPEAVVERGEHVHVPPHNQPIVLEPGEALKVGTYRDNWRVSLHASLRDDETLVVRCRPL